MLEPDEEAGFEVVGDFVDVAELVVSDGTEQIVGGDVSTAASYVEYVGKLRVSVVGNPTDKKKPAIVAFHDIGSNAMTCFGNFLEHCRRVKIMPLVESVIFFVDAPGHEENAPTIPEQEAWCTIADLAEELEKVVTRFQIQRFIGFGVGAGARVLLEYALNKPKTVRGLTLVSPVIDASGMMEWMSVSSAVRNISHSGWNERLQQRLMTRWLSPKVLEDKENPIRIKHDAALNRLNPYNIARFLYAYANRKSIANSVLRQLQTRPLIIVGTASPFLDDSMRAFGAFPQATILELRGAGTLCLDEEKEKCAESLKLYLQGLGYV